MSISIKPLEDRIVVQTAEAEQTTASGLSAPPATGTDPRHRSARRSRAAPSPR